MKTLMSYVGLLAFALGVTAVAEPGYWPNRINVQRAAEKLAQEVEYFDTALHEISAPHDVIQVVHHFEETAMEFVEIARRGTYQEAYAEMSHIRQDVQLIRDQLYRYPQLLNYPKVDTEWRHVRTAYRNVDHQMFMFSAGRWTSEKVKELEKDLAEMEAYHAENR